jgi:hypothetical protein
MGSREREKGEGNGRINQEVGRRGKGRRAKETRELTKKLAEGGKEERAKETKDLTSLLGEGGARKGRRAKEAGELTRSWEKGSRKRAKSEGRKGIKTHALQGKSHLCTYSFPGNCVASVPIFTFMCL